jgi:hypothetical protein
MLKKYIRERKNYLYIIETAPNCVNDPLYTWVNDNDYAPTDEYYRGRVLW